MPIKTLFQVLNIRLTNKRIVIKLYSYINFYNFEDNFIQKYIGQKSVQWHFKGEAFFPDTTPLNTAMNDIIEI